MNIYSLIKFQTPVYNAFFLKILQNKNLLSKPNWIITNRYVYWLLPFESKTSNEFDVPSVHDTRCFYRYENTGLYPN